jgi:cation transport regulator
MSVAAFFSDDWQPLRSDRAAEVTAMPYRSNSDLPPSVQAHLPPHAQDIYREAFNHAFAAHVGDPRQEERAHRIAWAEVKRSYVKVGGSWIGRGGN